MVYFTCMILPFHYDERELKYLFAPSSPLSIHLGGYEGGLACAPSVGQ